MRKVISKTTFILFAAVLFMTGCKNEKEQVFTLDMPQFTGEDKTTFGSNNTTNWTVGDAILINSTHATVQAGGSVMTEPVTSVGGMYYSIYPGRATASSFNNTNGYTFTMPTTYNYSANELKAPMFGICPAGETVIRYTNLFTLLKLDFVTIPTQVTITSTNSAITGDFSASYNKATGEWTLVSPEPNSSNKTLTITNNGYASVMYIPLPAGNHKLTIEGVSNVSGTNVVTPFYKAMASQQYMQRSIVYRIKCAHPFSVSATKKVYFSPGNLQYYNTSTYPVSLDGNARWEGDQISSSSRLRFAQHQWDNNITSNNIIESRVLLVTYHDVRGNNSWIDLFGWATGNHPGRSRTSSLAYSGREQTFWGGTDFADWGNPTSNAILNSTGTESWRTWHTAGTWYGLSKDEWTYVVSRSGKWKLGTVNGTAGLILAPDDYNGSLSTSYSGTAWSNLEKRGVIFLPGSGYRHYGEGIVRSWGYSSDWNGYWSTTDASTSGDYYAHFLKFTTSGTPQVGTHRVSHSGTASSNKPAGLCVRLAQVAN